jgi:hypothetical protein
VHPNAGQAVATAAEQIGKPYEWAGSGPDSFDCSGLTSYAWRAAGVNIPRSSGAQYEALPKVSKDQLRPGDLIFFGTPIHHVGLYEGNGVMINAPQTGETVRRDSVHRRSDYVGEDELDQGDGEEEEQADGHINFLRLAGAFQADVETDREQAVGLRGAGETEKESEQNEPEEGREPG